MTAQSRTVLKSYFQRGLRPTQAQYGDLIDSFELVSGAATGFLPLTGGIMTGAIQLPGVPTSALAAANKSYVDALVAAVSAGGVVVGGSNTQVQYNNAGVLGGFTVSGDATLATTGVLTLANTAVSAGTYATPTITVDSKGRITSATAGGGGGGTPVLAVKTQSFTSSGTYTPSAGMLYCIAEVVGGGGGGGGTSYGSGGGAGGYGRSVITAATIGASQTVTIGAGGAANTAGGTSSLGSLISCTGGAAGTAAATTFVEGGEGGIGSSAQINVKGNNGRAKQTATLSGAGGNSYFGGGGRSAAAGEGGQSPTGYGSGGGGAANVGSGATGGAGFIFITEFCSVV